MTDTQRKPLGATMPERIQRKRTKGWRKPENTVCVDRSTKWGNPFPVGVESIDGDDGQSLKESLWAYQNIFLDKEKQRAAKTELRGKNLACWCSLDQKCHADILLEIANA